MIDAISKVALSELFITVISGVLVFAGSQYFLEFILKPRIKLREAYGELSSAILLYHAKCLNASLEIEHIELIKSKSANLLSHAWITYKSKHKRNHFMEIAGHVNLIVSMSETDNKNYQQIITSIKKIQDIDNNIKISYAV